MNRKHYLGIFFTVVLAVSLTILGVALLAAKAPNKEVEKPVETIIAPTKYDIVLECQKIASQATNEDWGYMSCLKELEESIDSLKIRLN